MASSAEYSEYSKEKGDEQHLLALPNNRQVAYACNGPEAATTVVLFFSGLMSIGSARSVPAPCQRIGARWIAPTPPGMGRSSTRDLAVPYHVSLARDMTALLDHLYPSGAYSTLYVAGGSYGTVLAQMLYGAPRALFPAGRAIAGAVLLAGFSPYRHDAHYARALGWQAWLSVGPPARLPGRPLQRLFRAALAAKMGSVDGAAAFLRGTLLDPMDAAEKEQLGTYLAAQGETEHEFVARMARAAVESCRNWDGFMEVADVLHADWGFEPAALDGAHGKPLLVVGSAGDAIGSMNSAWLAENYANATAKTIPGGHISSLYYMDDIWEEMMTWM
ncbi:hypothetical protein A9K55_005470 [Cordyceps militaris]|uniref:AB hydrolase-1 domain-containing protein n=1 Tax=Cordyceps militaris TaxID=73501 RepID=A0A2H4SDT0_CORMI|nr:hypothetical protein A9K55_005470 [Cordyceps militaris]